MQSLKVSIITVCLNSVKTVEQTFQSVINQHYENIEYIVIDGGSNDGTLDIIRKYESYIAYWVSEPDHGIYDAMNKGIKESTGDIIGIINSDDWYADDAIISAVNCFNENESVELVHGDAVYIEKNGRSYIEKGIELFDEDAGTWYIHPTVFVRKKIYEQYGLYDLRYRIFSDGAYMLNLRYNHICIKKIAKVLAYFRKGGVSNAPCYRNRRLIETKRIFTEIISHYDLSINKKHELYQILESRRLKYLFEYAVDRTKRLGKFSATVKAILEKSGKNGFALWGCGSDGRFLANILSEDDDFIRLVVDANSKLVGTVFFYNVISPVSSLSHQNLIIISSRKHEVSIGTALEEMCFRRIIDYLTYNDFMYNFIRESFGFLFPSSLVLRLYE